MRIPSETIFSLMRLAEEHQLEELSVTTPEGKFTVCRERENETTRAPFPIEVLQVPSVPLSTDTEAKEERNLVKVVSPLMGVFYRASSPGASPFVEEGDTVENGSILCIIEAMKVMNEIVSEAHGTVEKILPKNGDVVEAGGVLFVLRRFDHENV